MAFMLNGIYADCRKKALYSDGHYTECRYPNSRGAVNKALEVRWSLTTATKLN
jgi:hypothetical protein